MAFGVLVVLGVVVAAAVAAGGSASLGSEGRSSEEQRNTTEIDASATPTATEAATIVVDAGAPWPMPAPQNDSKIVTPRLNIEPKIASVAALVDGGAQEFDPEVVDPDAAPAADTSPIDASARSEEGDVSIEVDASVRTTTTSSIPHRRPPMFPTKKPPNRDVIINPFRKREFTRWR